MDFRRILDDGLFVLSFSVAVGLIALIIPAHGAALDNIQDKTVLNSANMCTRGEKAFCLRPDALMVSLPPVCAYVRADGFCACVGMNGTQQRVSTGATGGAFIRGL
jgi:hypothetical protein